MSPPIQPWQNEPPHAIPPSSGPLVWFAKQFPGTAMRPGAEESVPTMLTQVRLDHGHGQFRGLFSPWDLRRFAEWLMEQATLAETNIQVAQSVPKAWPPGLVPPNGRSS